MKKRIKITPIEDYFFTVSPSMRYETLGDYFKDFSELTEGNGINIQVYKGLSPIERKAVAIHELVEQTLLELKGITPEMVDKWDTEDTGGAFDPNMYSKNKWYKKADKIALKIEKKIIKWAGMNWREYDKRTDNLKIQWKKKKHLH